MKDIKLSTRMGLDKICMLCPQEGMYLFEWKDDEDVLHGEYRCHTHALIFIGLHAQFSRLGPENIPGPTTDEQAESVAIALNMAAQVHDNKHAGRQAKIYLNYVNGARPFVGIKKRSD